MALRRAAVLLAVAVLSGAHGRAWGWGPHAPEEARSAGTPKAQTTQPAQEQDLLRLSQDVLDRRVAALQAGDRGAWMGTVDPRAPKGFQESQGKIFDGLRSLPLASYSLEARLQDSGDLAPGIAAKYRGTRVFLPETRQRHRFNDYDERDAVDSLWLTFVERDGKWFVASDTDLEVVGLETARGLWELGPVEVLPTEHVLVLHHPDQAERARALSGIVEEAIGVFTSRWDRTWSARIPLVLPGSVDELKTLLQLTIDADKFVAFVAYGATHEQGYAATAPRIYIQDRNLSRYGRRFQVETLVHELTHAASVPLAGPYIPVWVHEGVADWVATGRGAGERKPSGSDGRLPRDYEFSTGSQDAIIRAYAESRSAASYLASRTRGGGPTALLAELGTVKVAPGEVDHHVDLALRRVVAAGLADFERAWSRR